ncbi:hypothetical protein [Cryobacterium sp. CG_9.6]|uniref:hypothetical protein n=1 Tax=Cryobacterium sp. CG_9.6 TaxID=2760710 RepID=UPI002475DEFE|nr:hypothetical protein [Cryobacterium sp. CG_9.6]MDH6236663.1 hypothetical protein [Cryobacterium sp. CG_9.6]
MSDLSGSLLGMSPFDGPAPWTSPLERATWLDAAAARAGATRSTADADADAADVATPAATARNHS